MRELSLFSGAGGGLLGTHLLGWTPCGYVEWDDYCQRVLAARIADGYLPVAPIFGDVRQFVESGAAAQYRGIADVVSAGFPCQPFSVAGKQLAADDDRDMWPATRNVIRDVQPRSVLLENVPGLVSCGYLGTVLADLAALGYVGRWGVLGARHVGAPHKRDRLWVLGHAERDGRESDHGREPLPDGDRLGAAPAAGRLEFQSRPGGAGAVADAFSDRGQGRTDRRSLGGATRDDAGREALRSGRAWWGDDPAESGLGRVADGVADRVDRLRAIGNGQVPAVVRRAWEVLA